MARKQVIINGKPYFIATLRNNPGNIVIGQNFVGEDGSYKNDRPQPFASFDSKHAGLRALMRDIRTKISHAKAVKSEQGYVPGATQSVRYIVSRFAPEADNNKTEAYINSIIQAVSKANGIPITKTKANSVLIGNNKYAEAGLPDLRVTGADIMAIVRQKIVHENGNTAFLVNGKYVPAIDYYMKDEKMFQAARRMSEVSLDASETTSQDLLDMYYDPRKTQKKEKADYGGLDADTDETNKNFANSMDEPPVLSLDKEMDILPFEEDDQVDIQIQQNKNKTLEELYREIESEQNMNVDKKDIYSETIGGSQENYVDPEV